MNTKTKLRLASGRIDEKSFNDLVRYGKLTKFGHTRLVALGTFIIIHTFRSIEKELIQDGKDMNDMYKIFNRWPHKRTFKVIDNLINPIWEEDKIISDNLRDELVEIITHEISNNNGVKQ